MENKSLVLNLLVYAEKVEKGAKQSQLLSDAKALGFQRVEIRREYFKDEFDDMDVIKKEAERLGIALFYSIPDELYVSGTINKKIQSYIDEAKKMGVEQIKLTIGEFNGDVQENALRPLIEQGIAITVENDQTQQSGTIAAIQKYQEAIKKADLPIGYVYDLGNWRFVGEDEEKAAALLTEYVTYIHVKDVRYQGDRPEAAGLDHGVIKWQKVLNVLPGNVPVAIEYPTMTASEILEAKEKMEAFTHD